MSSIKITKKQLLDIIAEETAALVNEGQRPGEISGEDLTAAITLAIDEVFQEYRPDLEATRVAFSNISRSIDAIFKESYAAGARAAELLGAQDFEKEFTPRSGQLTVPGIEESNSRLEQLIREETSALLREVKMEYNLTNPEAFFRDVEMPSPTPDRIAWYKDGSNNGRGRIIVPAPRVPGEVEEQAPIAEYDPGDFVFKDIPGVEVGTFGQDDPATASNAIESVLNQLENEGTISAAVTATGPDADDQGDFL